MKPPRLAAIAAILLCSLVIAQEKKAAIKEAPAGGEVGEIRLRNMAAITYVYVETETTFDKLGEVIQETMPKLAKAAEDGKFKLSLPFVLSYPGGMAHVQPQKPFKVQVGCKVEGDASASGDVKVRTSQEFRAATILYTGPPAGIGECYQKLFPAIKELALELSGEDREFTLYWEGFESPNNIILIQVGVKEKAAK